MSSPGHVSKVGFAVGLLACLSATTLAVPGPDVVVSTVGSGVTKYGTKNIGTAQSPVYLTGYAVATVSCNIGDADAEWFEFTPHHPLIGTQLYRHLNGRFEQIGLNWLKHGYCAADAPNCTALGPPGSTYRPNSSCDWLGPFATDTYGSNLNGNQPDCGPRSEVRPTTGTYTYPYVLGWNASGDCAYKRLQIRNTDLDPAGNAGARYFCEVHYITTDEAAPVRFNNASYREMLVGGLTNGPTNTNCTSTQQGYTLSFLGATVPLQPAINAWRSVDPTVTLSTVDVPGDGRIIVGAKVTDLGGGLWQYEYAVYNHNSDRGIGRFSIAKSGSAAATFTNIGFHDVDYHSGEVYDGTDWTASLQPGSLEWATTPFATNPNANALRWSTIYNFRFQSNMAPTTGAVTLGLFKPGDPASVDATSLPVPSMPTVFCLGDFNHSGGAPTVQDIFDFLAAYFANDLSADINGVGGVSVQDIFDFLAAYFSGCM